jgi:D-hexose-6-phosphate mutarotase
MPSSLVRVTLPPTVTLDAGEGGLARLTVRNAQARAQIYLHGAHVTAWQPDGHANVLWTSRQSHWDAAKPIRGGVPICFPWFGPHATDRTAPSHGIARLRDWALVEARDDAEGATVLAFLLHQNAFSATYRVTVGARLGLALEVRHPGAGIFTYEEALHSFFAVQDVRAVEIRGLEGTEYLDKVGDATRRKQGASPIRFTGETDRIYLDTQAACTIHDPGLRRRIVVRKTGSDATVVWNPWIVKAAAMPDFRDDEWPEMVCVETGNVNAHAVTLAAGATHTLTATIEVQTA